MSHRPIRGSYCPPPTNERQGSADVTELMTMSPSQFITDVTTNQQPLSSAIVNGEFGKFVHHQCSPDLSDCIFLLHNISHWTRETDAIIVIPHIAQSHPDSEPFTRDWDSIEEKRLNLNPDALVIEHSKLILEPGNFNDILKCHKKLQ